MSPSRPGTSSSTPVRSAPRKHRAWKYNNGNEPNLYIMDSSIFPTSVGANPMQSIYTFAKILADRLKAGID